MLSVLTGPLRLASLVRPEVGLVTSGLTSEWMMMLGVDWETTQTVLLLSDTLIDGATTFAPLAYDFLG